MSDYRCGVKLKSTAMNTAALKILRKWFPNRSLAELRDTIQTHGYVYLTDMEGSQSNGERQLAKLLREFDGSGIESELYEEYRRAPGLWSAKPLSREVLHNMIRQSRDIFRETMENIELETEGYISPEAAAGIAEAVEEEFSEDDG